MTGDALASAYEFSYFAINRNPNELTHQDRVFIPAEPETASNSKLPRLITRPFNGAMGNSSQAG
jgi:hypothetical protein